MHQTSGLVTLFLIACTQWCSGNAYCNFYSITTTNDTIVKQTNLPSSDQTAPPCIWLISAAPSTSRLLVDLVHFGTTPRDYLQIGNGHNITDDDSIFVKLKGADLSLIMVSSGNKLWIKLSTDRNSTEMLQIQLEVYHEHDPVIECLPTCQCILMNNELEVQCIMGWTIDIIARLPSHLSHLTLSGGTMASLKERAFARLPNLQSLALLGNDVTVVQNNTFGGLNSLQLLNLSSNDIHDIQRNAFNGLSQLNHLDIRVNKLTKLYPDRLKTLPALQKLYLHNNHLEELPGGLCDYFLQNTVSLRLDGNSLTEIPPGIFNGCHMIITLKLSRNQITHLQNGSFEGLTEMWSLELSRNKIERIDRGAFTDLAQLVVLRLKENNIVSFREYAFVGLSHLFMLDLRYNPWTNIESYAFWGMPNLTFIFLEREGVHQINGRLTLRSLDGLNSLKDMLVDDYRLCCLKPDVCSPQTAPPLFHTCKRLMPNTVLQTLLWLLGISAMAGNLYVIVLRCQEKHVRNPTQAILILNLALSDLIMGFYMLIIAGADVHFGQEFFLSAEIWKSSGVCMFAGFLSLFSSEASVFFVVLISVDRLLCIALPFGKKRMTVHLAKMSCTIVWVTVTILGIVAAILQVADTNAYDLATVCVGIPLVSTKKIKSNKVSSNIASASGASLHKFVPVTEGTASTWQFAIAIYLGINLLAFVIVLACYVSIAAIVAAKLPSKQLQRKNDRRREMKMAGRMALIVFTDFCCWMPVIILGILIQSGVVEAVPIETYAWIVALVLPLNSALNPYIYTISTELTKCKRKRREKREEFTLRKTTLPSQTMNSQAKTSRYTNL
ncbi:uncharacterized protein [Amphiura filiformis]|uniref:uncharacterized protein n=1 Tax=Amphiura filiformis TaxID=82378 RepID=UPI003B21BF9E